MRGDELSVQSAIIYSFVNSNGLYEAFVTKYT